MRGAIAAVALLALAVSSSASNAAAPRASDRLVAIAVTAQSSFAGVPLVYDVVTPRTPMASVVLRLVGEPALPPSTPVHWSIADGKNVLTPPNGTDGGRYGSATYDTDAGRTVDIYPRDATVRGDAIVVADVGDSVRQRATVLVRDVAGISFGCYMFTTAGPSVRFSGDVATRTSLADADVAVVGPGGPNGGGPAPGCGGENYDPAATSPRLVFRSGGRVLRGGYRPVFVRELPYEAVDLAHPLDVQTHDGTVVRLHVSPGAGAYFVGWAEQL